MRVYVEIARLAFRQNLAYRTAAVAGLFTNSVFGVILASVMISFYGSLDAPSVEGWSRSDAVTLIWINQALIMPVYIWGWWEVSKSIQSGAIASDFLRPISWYGLWLGREAGRATVAILLRLFPTLFVGWLLFDIALPATALQGFWFLIAVALAVWVSFSIRLLLNLTSFWLIDHRGVAATSMSIGTFLSGMAMPIDFFPTPLRTVAEVLPFQAVMMAPNTVYLGKGSALAVYGTQVMWVGVLGVACIALLRQGEKKLVVHGG